MHRTPARYVLIIMGVLVGAVVCYATGFGLGISFLLIAGAVLELAFWILALTNPTSSGKDV